jgi:hypothetical protein
MRVSCWGRIWRTAALSGRIAIHAPGGRRQKLQPPLQQEVAKQHRFTMTQFNTRQLELYPRLLYACLRSLAPHTRRSVVAMEK